MTDPKPAERIVLKILTGVQSGAEVSLEPGEYLIGSGPDDDIQVIDVSLKAGHLRARLAPGKIEIRNGAGSFSTAAARAPSTDDWQELQPLDVVAAGATRFALGPPTAQWATITDQTDLARGGAGASAPAVAPAPSLFSKARSLAAPLALLIVVCAFCGSLLLAFGHGAILKRSGERQTDVATMRAALNRYSFGRALTVRQDVDGAIYVTGYVESPVERRAVTNAIDDTGISVRLRLGVLQILRSELDGLIKAERVPIVYTLAKNGVLDLQGVILAPDAAERFLGEVKQNVVGLSEVRSHIRTAADLLTEIRQLAHLSQVDDAVVFRLNGTVVEANGLISAGKIDQWVGFLQAYSKRFSDKIGLRSFVALQSPQNADVAQNSSDAMTPILLGVVPDGRGVGLDANRLANGELRISDAFAGGAAAATNDITPRKAQAQARPFAPNPSALAPRLQDGPIARAQPAPGARTDAADNARLVKDPPNVAPRRAQLASIDATLPLDLPIDVRRSSATDGEAPSAEPSESAPRPDPPGEGQRPRKAAARVDPPGDTIGPRKAAALPDSQAARTIFPRRADPRPLEGQSAASSPRTQLQSEDKAKSKAADDQPLAASPKRKALPATFRHDVGDMTDRAASLVDQWLGGGLITRATAAEEKKNQAIERALDTLANQSLGVATPPDSLSEASKELFARKYLPLFALSRKSTIDAARECRRGSRLSLDDLPAALFWLDLMSTTNAVTLRDFSPDAQGFILEAALNPALDADCLRRDPATASLVSQSIYLTEAQRNPEFVRFVTQSLPTFPLDVTGASLLAPRFVQLRDGTKLHEGEAPDASSRIDTVGELGLSILLADGFATVIYPTQINWLAAR